MGVDDGGVRICFPLTTKTKKAAYCRKAKKQKLIDEEDERDMTRRPMPRESAKTEEQREEEEEEEEEASVLLSLFSFNFCLHQ
jgi:hypothetical protein